MNAEPRQMQQAAVVSMTFGMQVVVAKMRVANLVGTEHGNALVALEPKDWQQPMGSTVIEVSMATARGLAVGQEIEIEVRVPRPLGA